MTIEVSKKNDLVNWLIYSSYEANRDRCPYIAPERWEKIYTNAKTYEKIYQEMKSKCHSTKN